MAGAHGGTNQPATADEELWLEDVDTLLQLVKVDEARLGGHTVRQAFKEDGSGRDLLGGAVACVVRIVPAHTHTHTHTNTHTQAHKHTNINTCLCAYTEGAQAKYATCVELFPKTQTQTRTHSHGPLVLPLTHA